MTRKAMLSMFLLASTLTATSLWAAAPKTYQVTGEVLESTGSKLVVQKGKEKWEIARDKDTKTKAEPQVGDKVTVQYTMTASEIEAKPAKGAKK